MTRLIRVRRPCHRTTFTIWFGLLLVLALGPGIWAIANHYTPAEVGTAVAPPQTMPNFELLDQNGQLTHLSDLKGNPVLLVFGYTHCPDFCPLSLVKFMHIKAALGDQAASVSFVFVSVDGERDTPEVMKRYISLFDPAFVGLTERAFVVAQVAAPYGARFERKVTHTTQTEYAVGHTTDMYLLDGEGKLIRKYAYAAEAPAIAQSVSNLLK